MKDISPDIIEKIKEIIEENEDCILDVNKSFQTYWFRNVNYKGGQETEFRIARLGDFQLLISRVYFENKRKGTMTRIMDLLKDYCKEEHIQRIRIQSVETYEMMCFCKKYPLDPCQENIWVDNILMGDYDLIV